MKKYIPNTITLLNLLFGFVAQYCAYHSGEMFGTIPAYMMCIYCIMLAAVADFFDGLSSRLLQSYSDLGKQLDSLSDLVSFGLAPACLLANLFEQAGVPFGVRMICALIPLMAALRLARFNIDPEQATTFKGLPVPACALFCIGLAAMMVSPTGINLYAGIGSIIAISLLMVAPVKMYSLKFKSLALRGNLLRYSLVIVAILCISLFGWEGLYYTIGYYVVSSFIANLFCTDI